jgi:hypothetical protein
MFVIALLLASYPKSGEALSGYLERGFRPSGLSILLTPAGRCCLESLYVTLSSYKGRTLCADMVSQYASRRIICFRPKTLF